MTRKLTAAMLVLMWVVSALLAWQVMAATTQSDPLTATVHVNVGKWQDTNPTQLYAELDDFAQAHHMTIARVAEDSSRGLRGGRDIFISAHEPAAPTLEASRYGFARSLPTQVKPLQEAGIRGINGVWVLFGSDDPSAAVQFFGDHGVQTQVTPLDDSPLLRPITSGGTAVQDAALLVVVAASIAVTVLHSRQYAIQRLHGWSNISTAWSQLQPALVTWALSGVVVLAATCISLAAAGSGGITQFALQSLVFCAIFFATGIVIHLVTLALISRTEILGALKGELPAGWIVGASYLVRVLAVVTALSLGSQLVLLGMETRHLRETQEPLESLGNASVITFGNTFDQPDMEAAMRVDGQWMKRLDQRGQLMIAHRDDQILPTHPVVIVNSTYLRHYPLPGNVTTNHDVTVAIPADNWDERSEVSHMITSNLLDAEGGGLLATRSKTRVTRIPVDHDVFTFMPAQHDADSESSTDVTSAFVHDAIVVVVPNGSLASYSSLEKEEALVTDPDTAQRDLTENPQVAKHVQSIVPVLTHARGELNAKNTELATLAMANIIIWAVVIMAGIAATTTHVTRHRMRTFIRTMNGWRATTTHRDLIIIEAALLVAIMCWLPASALIHARQQAQEFAMAGMATADMPAPHLAALDFAPVLILALVTTGGFIVTLTIAHRTVIRNAHRGL